MKALLMISIAAGLVLFGCQRQDVAESSAAPAKPTPQRHASNIPPLDPDNIVSIASASEDHTTLVAAIQAANYVTSVAASGPLTVFAPTNAAFEKLPAGTVEGLLEPDRADDLRQVLKYHVTTSSLGVESFRDGQSLGMANGAKVKVRVQGDRVSINDATIVASIPASNGTIHVIDSVLLPPAK